MPGMNSRRVNGQNEPIDLQALTEAPARAAELEFPEYRQRPVAIESLFGKIDKLTLRMARVEELLAQLTTAVYVSPDAAGPPPTPPATPEPVAAQVIEVPAAATELAGINLSELKTQIDSMDGKCCASCVSVEPAPAAAPPPVADKPSELAQLLAVYSRLDPEKDPLPADAEEGIRPISLQCVRSIGFIDEVCVRSMAHRVYNMVHNAVNLDVPATSPHCRCTSWGPTRTKDELLPLLENNVELLRRCAAAGSLYEEPTKGKPSADQVFLTRATYASLLFVFSAAANFEHALEFLREVLRSGSLKPARAALHALLLGVQRHFLALNRKLGPRRSRMTTEQYAALSALIARLFVAELTNSKVHYDVDVADHIPFPDLSCVLSPAQVRQLKFTG